MLNVWGEKSHETRHSQRSHTQITRCDAFGSTFSMNCSRSLFNERHLALVQFFVTRNVLV